MFHDLVNVVLSSVALEDWIGVDDRLCREYWSRSPDGLGRMGQILRDTFESQKHDALVSLAKELEKDMAAGKIRPEWRISAIMLMDLVRVVSRTFGMTRTATLGQLLLLEMLEPALQRVLSEGRQSV